MNPVFALTRRAAVLALLAAPLFSQAADFPANPQPTQKPHLTQQR